MRLNMNMPTAMTMDIICTFMRLCHQDPTAICIATNRCGTRIPMCRMHTTCTSIERYFESDLYQRPDLTDPH